MSREWENEEASDRVPVGTRVRAWLVGLTEPRRPSFKEKFGPRGPFGTPKHKIRPDPRGKLVPAMFIVVLLILLCVLVLCLAPLWKVTAVEAADGTRYSADVVLAASGLTVGDPLLGFDAADVEARIMKELPLLASVDVQKHPNGRVTVTTREESTLYYTQHYLNYYLISAETLRVLDVTSYAEDCRQAGAVYLGLPEEAYVRVGEKLSFRYLPYPLEAEEGNVATYEVDTGEAEEEYGYVLRTLNTIMDSSIGRYTTGMDLSDRYDLWFILRGRILVRLGSDEDVQRKLSQSMEVLMKQGEQTSYAVIDASDPMRITYREDPALTLPSWARADGQ